VRIGSLTVTVDLRLYLREKTVRRLNRGRAPEQRLPFRSKNTLARLMLAALRPLLPAGWGIYVQFDSWYASARLIKYVRRQGWHVTCGLKCNRQLNGIRLDQLAYQLRHRRYTHVRVTAADGNRTTYYVRGTTGRLEDVPYDVRVFFSKRHPREKSPAYFMSTDLTRSAHQALQGYRGRWSCEVVNFYLKTQLGLADFRVHSYEAVDKYIVVVLLAWAYVERRFEQEAASGRARHRLVAERHRDGCRHRRYRVGPPAVLTPGSSAGLSRSQKVPLTFKQRPKLEPAQVSSPGKMIRPYRATSSLNRTNGWLQACS